VGQNYPYTIRGPYAIPVKKRKKPPLGMKSFITLSFSTTFLAVELGIFDQEENVYNKLVCAPSHFFYPDTPQFLDQN